MGASRRGSAAHLAQIRMAAGGQGFEPRFSGPKPDVLPLDDPPGGARSIDPGCASATTRAAPRAGRIAERRGLEAGRQRPMGGACASATRNLQGSRLRRGTDPGSLQGFLHSVRRSSQKYETPEPAPDGGGAAVRTVVATAAPALAGLKLYGSRRSGIASRRGAHPSGGTPASCDTLAPRRGPPPAGPNAPARGGQRRRGRRRDAVPDRPACAPPTTCARCAPTANCRRWPPARSAAWCAGTTSPTSARPDRRR